MTSDDPVGWIGCLDELRRIAERLGEQARTVTGSPREADVAVKVFGVIMGAYLTHLWAEPDHPAFLPSVGYHQMYGSPSPDTIYRTAAVDGTGTYRIVGNRGTAPDVSLMPFGPPVAGGLQTFAPFDLDDLSIHDDGTFEVELSAHRPSTAGNWWRLEPEMRALMLRSVSDQWGEHTDPRVAIVRLDTDPRRTRVDPAALARRFRSYATVAEAMVMSGVDRVARLRDDAVVNRLVTIDYSATGGGLDDQWYQEGCFAVLDDGEVLLVETPLDPACRGFSLSLTDAAFSTIDWANAHSSLNRRQAVIDPDGGLRVVVATTDPGVRNWLDTTGHRSGVLQFRWSGTSAAPDVSLRVVPAAALDDTLPSSTSRVSPEQRAEAIRARQIGVQLRRAVVRPPTTSELILAAARRTIRARGPEKLTLSAVAVEAGVPRPTIYRWFPTKSLLLGAIAAYEVEQFDVGLRHLAEQHRDPGRRLDAALRYLVTYLDETVGADSVRTDPEFALQGLADSLPPHITSLAQVLGDALDEVPNVRAGTVTREQAAEMFLRLAYSQYLVPHHDPEALLATMRAFAGLPRRTRRRAADWLATTAGP